MSHSPEGQMFSMIRQRQVSGISQIEFCKKKSVSYATFHYWYKNVSIPKKQTV
ncbi:MAG: IS66 family insertion sequence element accessory protein TnpA [Dolichospermum sp.]